jgi:BirA family transcriptional regulator, biotin operon repressor / biotin---[acetyl-CoA-carboxylase] ligase
LYKIPAKTLFTGQNLIYVPECHSTNTLMSDMLPRQPLPEGTVVVSDFQTAGRGQRGNSWESGRGMNLTFSVLFTPSFVEVTHQFDLTRVVSLAVADVVGRYLPVRIKWPNDIMVNDRKICGILIENQVQGNRLSKSIVGIGLNIHQRHFSSPLASSLALESNHTFVSAEVLEHLLEALEHRYLQLRQHQQELLRQHYLEHLYWKGESHQFLVQEQLTEGTIQGVDLEGRLQLQTAHGTSFFRLKEIRYLA